ncbi:hypothetical protein TNCV_3629071 [Trichonephila clavipes]|nr:hypothetical protein TNCV_3629071 [Trichonephila clavipes]
MFCVFVAGGTLNNRRATSPLVRLVEGEERWLALDHLQGVPPLNRRRNELNRTITCMVLKATVNDRRTSSLRKGHDNNNKSSK